MCGIFGVIKKERSKVDIGVLRGLAIANRERGKEALGFFNSKEEIFKKADDPLQVLATGDCTEWLDSAEQDSWFIVGHTRYGTRGANIDSNSHPFQYGSVIGSHNGIVDCPQTYKVDSEYVIDLLDQNNSNYQKALEDVSGYWTLGWYDNRKRKLFITMHNNSCGIVQYRGAWYFSSDSDHLASVLGVRETIELKSGDTVSFSQNGSMQWRKKFVSNIKYAYKKDTRTSGYYNNYHSSSATTDTSWPAKKWDKSESVGGVKDPDNTIRDYDEEFRQLWEEYAHQYDAV